MVPTTHSSFKPNKENQYHLYKRVQNFKFKDEDDLLKENFETRFDDDLGAILGANFIGMVTILPTEFGAATESEIQDDDCFDIFLGQECLFLDEDSNDNVLFEKSY